MERTESTNFNAITSTYLLLNVVEDGVNCRFGLVDLVIEISKMSQVSLQCAASAIRRVM
jgi:hypothetical protein